ncbi:UDP-N-acetylglucosamine 4,6-dehydratase (inverting) [Candidatus Babeliales bacterium]|nr:UDP-N-acetylglucosamine 4,6-dehydratase (inverting) [Candidatus Babeliales bacterium]
MIKDKTILITGGTGTLGKAVTSEILKRYEPKRVIVFSRDEYKQFIMSQQMPFKGDKRLLFMIGDVRDQATLMNALRGVDIVVHTAALKHVSTCELNPYEAIKTNVLGAQNLIQASIEQNVKKVVVLSTDKACAPINLYGATKLCSDKLFINANSYSCAYGTAFSVVRFGNIAGSRGSVIPYFRGLIDQGIKKLPITDVRMTRFCLEEAEAIKMILKTIDIMHGGELFVKKAPSMRIIDLAHAICEDASLYEIGMRPGERIDEAMIVGEEVQQILEFEDYFLIKPSAELDLASYVYIGGRQVDGDFEYTSSKNMEWLSIQQLQDLMGRIKQEPIFADLFGDLKVIQP